jgi:hypothetical protein
MGKIKVWVLGLLLFSLLTGCESVHSESSRGEDWDYTVVPTADIPEDFQTEIQEKKVNSFQMTYDDGEYLYIAVGYGEQESGGYSIQVEGLHEKGEDLCLETTLTGPGEDVVVSDKASFPYLVVKTKKTEKNVVFDQ